MAPKEGWPVVSISGLTGVYVSEGCCFCPEFRREVPFRRRAPARSLSSPRCRFLPLATGADSDASAAALRATRFWASEVSPRGDNRAADKRRARLARTRILTRGGWGDRIFNCFPFSANAGVNVHWNTVDRESEPVRKKPTEIRVRLSFENEHAPLKKS